uniref:Uncharacterized protein n=1 Tax=Meloidogyne hapla TaxID=6305 RepID=A0A1I8C0N7_MELHA
MLARRRFSIDYFSVCTQTHIRTFVSKRIIFTQIQRKNWFSNKNLFINNNGLFIIPQLRNFSSAVQALAESFPSSSLFCNENFSLKKEWNERFKQIEKLKIGYDASEWIMLVQKKYSGGGKASAVDLDIASVMSQHNDQINDLIELCYKLRHTNNATDLFPSTEYAIFRLILENGDFDNFMKILNDPINYGLFPNEHCCCLYLNYFLNINDLQSAARLAVYVMHQEMFSQPLLNYLSVQSLLQFIEQNPDGFPEFEQRVFPRRANTIEEEIDFNEENVRIFRFPWLKTPHSDGHFDLQKTNELIGRSLELLSWNLNENNKNILNSSIHFLGILLSGKYQKGLNKIEEIQNLVSSNDLPILLKTLQISIPFLKNKLENTKNENNNENERTEENILLENEQKGEELIVCLKIF